MIIDLALVGFQLLILLKERNICVPLFQELAAPKTDTPKQGYIGACHCWSNCLTHMHIRKLQPS